MKLLNGKELADKIKDEVKADVADKVCTECWNRPYEE